MTRSGRRSAAKRKAFRKPPLTSSGFHVLAAPVMSIALDLPAPDFEFPLLGKAEEKKGLLKRLSARHHRLAQMLGEGVPPGEAGLACGYCASRVSILQTDPSFKQLVDFYAAQRHAAFVKTGQKLAEVADTAIEILQDRLEDSPNEFTVPQLLSVITTAADRTGLGPTQTQRNVQVVVTGEQLEELKRRVLQSQPGSVKLLPAQPLDGGGGGSSGPAADAPSEERGGEEGAPLRAGSGSGASEVGLEPGSESA